jgi:hypothetical protein
MIRNDMVRTMHQMNLSGIRIELRPCTVRILVRRKYRLLVIKSSTAVLRFAAQPASGNNLLLVSAAIGQLSATGVTGTKQQYGGCNRRK